MADENELSRGLLPGQWLLGAPIYVRRLVCAAYAILIAALSLAPGKSFSFITPLFPHEDKVVHVLMYALLALFMLWAAAPVPGRETLRWLIFSVALCFAYGALLEVAQELVRPNDRQFSIGDMIANTLGAVLAAAAWKLALLPGKVRKPNE